MITYFVLLFVSALFCFVAKSKEKYIFGSNEYITKNNLSIPLFFLFLWVLLACRSIEIGNDTANYKTFFLAYANRPFSQIFDQELEPLYAILNWLVGQITNNFQIFLAVVGVIIIAPIVTLYKKDRSHSYLKIILFVNMPVFIMMFSGIRQSIAMSIGLVAFSFVKKKKWFAFLISVIIAIGFHTSAFMLFAMYPLYYFTFRKRHLYFIIPLMAAVYIFNRPIFTGLSSIMSLFGTRYDAYEASDTGAVTMIILLMMFMVYTYVIPDDSKINGEYIGMRNYLLLATLLQCFAPLHTLAMRMNYYYIMFIPIVVSEAANYAENRWKQIAKIADIVMCVFFTVYFLLNVFSASKTGGMLHTVPYIPFWVKGGST